MEKNKKQMKKTASQPSRKYVPRQSKTAAILWTLILLVYTLVVAFVDVKAIGPEGSSVGLASINAAFRDLVGQSGAFKIVSDIGFYFCVALCVFFIGLFLYQLLKRKSLQKVDRNLIALMYLYAMFIVLYLVFNSLIIVNYRPILKDGALDPSYPSTHVFLGIVAGISAIDRIFVYVKRENSRLALMIVCWVALLLSCLGRTMSGMHWLTDILGGFIFASVCLAWYRRLWMKLENL